MFFSQIVLSKKSKLGTIWLAGHWDKKINKKLVFKQDIPKAINQILHPHLPMALRMTSHLMLGVVRIFSKKTKYLLADCSEAVTKLKGLNRVKSKTKVDLPVIEQVDPQSLLTSGPRQQDSAKPQVYKDVDRFLRNIDITDLVVDAFYDPSKLNPEHKKTVDYSEFRSPDQPGLGQVGFQSESGELAESSLKKHKKDEMELRDDGSIPLFPKKTPTDELEPPSTVDSINKQAKLDPLLGSTWNRSSDSISTPQDLTYKDSETVVFHHDFQGIIDFNDQVQDQVSSPQKQKPPPSSSPPVEKELDSDKSSDVEGDGKTTETPAGSAAKKTRKRISRNSLSAKDIRRFDQPRGLLAERTTLPFNQSVVISKTNELSPKHQLLAPIRIAMAEKLQKFYRDTLQHSIPAIVGINMVLPLGYLRAKRSFNVVTETNRENGFLSSNQRSVKDLGIPEFTDYNSAEEKNREKILLASLNDRDLESERTPASVPTVLPENADDKMVYDLLLEEIKLRGEHGSPLIYKPLTALDSRLDSRDSLLRKTTPGQLTDISPYKAVPNVIIDKTPLKSLRELENQVFPDIGTPQPDYNDLDFIPGQAQIHTPQPQVPFQPDDEFEEQLTDKEAKEKTLREIREKQSENRKKVWTKNTAKVHSILDKKFKQLPTVNFINDVLTNETKIRTKAAGIFYELLILKTKDLIQLNQSEPYGDITIEKAPDFDHTHSWKIVDDLKE
ncbi:hypothetical protein DLAC_09432 [Tieghemostelium lacteum]|uniref:Rad21/Rec8-like protein N-terminal domain-containing protein n=1 Tax=Tieghemostelium lacteum TaxID=361077 RepID=A0A151ZA48_TIELA|nr:hypothetical protein DLAC_09432 [Tieghemostelium lacteum]|eukprot:KYQ90793.1 hypothetical protein DLAC_09432 [Tieghemostelium lacteum]